MGWQPGHLTRAGWLGLALGIGALARAAPRAPAPGTLPAPPSPATEARTDELSPEDRELLRDLELLEALELLRGWDPGEDLPIPSGKGGTRP